MLKTIKQVVQDSLSEDGPPGSPYIYCGAKVAAFIAIFSYLGLVGYGIHLAHTLDVQGFGTGLAATLAGCGVLIWGKQANQKTL
jgi:hypothetical protein